MTRGVTHTIGLDEFYGLPMEVNVPPMYSCGKCSAVVLAQHLELHREWHQNLKSVIFSAVQSIFGSHEQNERL